MKKTLKTANMTSFHGHTIAATPAQLKKLLGEPTYNTNDGFDKVNLEWVMENNSGAVFTIYDWKSYTPLSDEQVVRWHIGGHNGNVTAAAQKELETVI